MTTSLDLIDTTLDWLLGGTDEEVNVLTSAPDTDDTMLTFAYELNGIVPGATICVDLEVMRVVDANSQSSTATVLRGQRGSTATSHATGAVTQVGPRFSRWSVLREINTDLDSLSGAGLYQMATVDLTFNAAITGYDLTGVTSIEQIYSIRYQTPGSEKDWPKLERRDYRYDSVASTTDFPSGSAVFVYQGGYPGHVLRVAYKKPFEHLSTITDDVQDVTGLAPTAHDIPSLGAAIRLIAGHEAGRIAYEIQPDTRRPAEVPVGSNVNTSTGWARLRNARIDDELRRQARRYPEGG